MSILGFFVRFHLKERFKSSLNIQDEDRLRCAEASIYERSCWCKLLFLLDSPKKQKPRGYLSSLQPPRIFRM